MQTPEVKSALDELHSSCSDDRIGVIRNFDAALLRDYQRERWTAYHEYFLFP
jgi:hypothetical protein